MHQRIRTIGFRNSIYLGETEPSSQICDQPQGIGIMLDDMFLMCLSRWQKDDRSLPVAHGPTLIIFPNRQIFYSQQYPSQGKLYKNWCYINSQFQIYGNGQSQWITVVYSSGSTIDKVKLSQKSKIQSTDEISFNSQQEKWKIIEKILKTEIREGGRGLQNFLSYYFINNKHERQQIQVLLKTKSRNNQNFYYVKNNNNEALGFVLKYENNHPTVSTTGYYKQLGSIKKLSFGRTYKNLVGETYEIQQGDFQKQEQYNFKSYQSRPQDSFQTSRRYFRQTTQFCNRFVNFKDFDTLYIFLANVSNSYTQIVSYKFGQKIIEGENQKFDALTQQQKNVYHKNIKRQYTLQEAKANIQSEISRRRGSTTNRTTGYFNPDPYIQKIRSRSRSINEDSPRISDRLETKRRSPGLTKGKYKYTEELQQQTNKILSSPITHIYRHNSKILNPQNSDILVPEFTLNSKRQNYVRERPPVFPQISERLANITQFDKQQMIKQMSEREYQLNRMYRQIEQNQIYSRAQQAKYYHRYSDYLSDGLDSPQITKRVNPAAHQLSKLTSYRKYCNFNYTEDSKDNRNQLISKPSVSPMHRGKPIKLASTSPVSRLNESARVDTQKQNMEKIKKPFTSTKARKVFTYLE